jgi:hypothetical protein
MVTTTRHHILPTGILTEALRLQRPQCQTVVHQGALGRRERNDEVDVSILHLDTEKSLLVSAEFSLVFNGNQKNGKARSRGCKVSHQQEKFAGAEPW